MIDYLQFRVCTGMYHPSGRTKTNNHLYTNRGNIKLTKMNLKLNLLVLIAVLGIVTIELENNKHPPPLPG